MRSSFDKPALSTVHSFDRLRTNGVEGLRTNGENRRILPFVVSLSNHEPRFVHIL
jgi:hypothetical protein